MNIFVLSLPLFASLGVFAINWLATDFEKKSNPKAFLDKLRELAAFGGERETIGLRNDLISKFLEIDPDLGEAIDLAYKLHLGLRKEFADILKLSEKEQIEALQVDLVNFYPKNTVNPYVSLAAKGPWVITSTGAVIHDSGGYGMIGIGHNPGNVSRVLAKPQVMANVMTANFSQKRFTEQLRKEVGHKRTPENRHPFDKFLCLNSGSEAVTVAARITDINAGLQTKTGAKHEGKEIKFLGLKGAFHGRTDRPAQVSDSSLGTYKKVLASFRDRENLVTVEPNNLEQLKKAFEDADRDGVFFEAMFLEPVMGEGNPGKSITPEFYQLARGLTVKYNSLLLVDSIQAGLRARGYLSIVDYPGFEDLEGPDFETYSKALNAGQYPLSVLAMNAKAANLYVMGVYGNTMTTSPRALEVACEVLVSMTDDLRRNIQNKGEEFLERLRVIAEENPGVITDVQGTGLLFSIAMSDDYKVTGDGSFEEYLRKQGLGIIHGGVNSLRFTPHFNITSVEIDLMMDLLREGIIGFKSQS
ncbi:MAG: acetylornithine/succinyldiaminopimelate/putrescine aminotransferase [Chlamydiales bacterium]|jgi:acetylornithine/succinyldiaminopimelate/putrescine aminotransferase